MENKKCVWLNAVWIAMGLINIGLVANGVASSGLEKAISENGKTTIETSAMDLIPYYTAFRKIFYEKPRNY